jgi:stromal membrane-associated protein
MNTKPGCSEFDQDEHETQALLRAQCGKIENAQCADCQAGEPSWASVNEAVFICTQCAGVHRSIGVHISFVLSVTLDNWQASAVKAMVSGGGNMVRNKALEFHVPGAYSKPAAQSSREERERFIKAKYVDKLFVEHGEGCVRKAVVMSPPPKTPKLSTTPQGMVDNLGVLFIRVIEGTELLAMDSGGSTSAYCNLTLGNQSVKSTVVRNSLSPVWNEALMLCWDGTSPLDCQVCLQTANDEAAVTNFCGRSLAVA